MFKKSILLLSLLLLIGCEQPETEEEKAARLAQEALTQEKKDNNIIYGGTGTQADPYKIFNGVYGALSNGDFYYSFDLAGNNCSSIFYTKTGYVGTDYPLTNISNNNLLDRNQSEVNFVTYNKDMNTSKYLLFVSDIDIPNDKFGFYSSCVGDSYIIPEFTIGVNNFTAYQNLYKINIDSNSTLSIKKYSDLHKLYIFDSNFSLIGENDFITTDPYDKNLTSGMYYFLAQGYSSTSEVIFRVDKN